MHAPLIVRRSPLPVALTTAAVLGLWFPAPALADVNPGEIAGGMQDNSGLYIDPQSRYLKTDAQLDALRRVLERSRLPVRIAVLPADAVTADPKAYNRLLIDIYENTRRQATYAVVIGDRLQTYSWTLTPARTQQITRQALKAGGGNMNVALYKFAQLAGNSSPGKPGPGPDAAPKPTPQAVTETGQDAVAETGPGTEDSKDGGIPWPLVLGGAAVVVLGGAGGFFFLRSRRKPGTAPAPAGAPVMPGADGQPAAVPPSPTSPTSSTSSTSPTSPTSPAASPVAPSPAAQPPTDPPAAQPPVSSS